MDVKQPSRSFLTILTLLAFLGGVGLASFFLLDFTWLLGIISVGFLAALLGKKFPPVLLVGMVLVGGGIGMLRYNFALQDNSPHPLSKFNDIEREVTLTGEIVAEPDSRNNHTKYTLEVSAWSDGIIEKYVSGRVLIKTQKLPEYFYGDELQLRGKLQTPFETEEFSYRDYLARNGIKSVMYYPSLKKISSGNGNIFLSAMYQFKAAFEAKLNQIYPEPHASFMAGLLIGSRRSIPQNVMDNFNTVGLTHIIAISGYNIALVIALITGLFGSLLPRRWQFPVAFIFVVAFTLLVGANAAVVRAAIMGLLAFFALTIGRQYHAGVAITLTAAAMILWNPHTLQDVSFQLSFAAVLGLMFISPLLEKYLAWIPNKFAIRESLLMTFSAQVTAVPLIVFYFARLSLISPLANVLVAPAIPLAMLLGALSIIAGWIFLPAGILIGFLAYGLLTYILKVAEWGSALPFASLEVNNFTFALVIIYYAALIGFLIYKYNFQKRKMEAPLS